MITLGVDAHKSVHAAVALDDAGRELGRWRGANSRAGWAELYRWGAALGPPAAPRRWGIEGAWNYGRGLAQHLVGAGETVHEVSPCWTAEGRRRARRRGKSDALDASAVARFVRQEAATLPPIAAEDETAVLDLLVTERAAAVAEAVRLRNRVHQLLLQLDPEYRTGRPALRTKAGLAAAERYATASPRALDQERAAAVRRLARRLRGVLEEAAALAEQIRARAAAGFAPLTRVCGVSLLTAGTLAGLLGPGPRFRTDAQLAAFAGAAPLEASSAGIVRHRLNRGGNRQLNRLLHQIALTQSRHAPEARAYLARRAAEGKTRREAFRALKRFLARAVWRRWQECLAQGRDSLAAPAAPTASAA